MNVADGFRPQAIALGRLLAIWFALTVLALGLGLIPLPEGVELPGGGGWAGALLASGATVALSGGLAVVGLWLTRKLGLPGVFRLESDRRDLLLHPLLLGVGVGVAIVLGNHVFVAMGAPSLPHPEFPGSLVASAAAAIGEEVLFRLFILSFWAFLLNLLLKRWTTSTTSLWIANFIAAMAFAAGHLPAAMMLTDVATPDQIPPLVLVEMFLLNGLLGVVAGERFMKDGLVAAIGVHFWADIVWHVLAPLAG